MELYSLSKNRNPMRIARETVCRIIIFSTILCFFLQGELDMTGNLMRNKREEASLILTDSANLVLTRRRNNWLETQFQHENRCVCVSDCVCLLCV